MDVKPLRILEYTGDIFGEYFDDFGVNSLRTKGSSSFVFIAFKRLFDIFYLFQIYINILFVILLFLYVNLFNFLIINYNKRKFIKSKILKYSINGNIRFINKKFLTFKILITLINNYKKKSLFIK